MKVENVSKQNWWCVIFGVEVGETLVVVYLWPYCVMLKRKQETPMQVFDNRKYDGNVVIIMTEKEAESLSKPRQGLSRLSTMWKLTNGLRRALVDRDHPSSYQC